MREYLFCCILVALLMICKKPFVIKVSKYVVQIGVSCRRKRFMLASKKMYAWQFRSDILAKCESNVSKKHSRWSLIERCAGGLGDR